VDLLATGRWPKGAGQRALAKGRWPKGAGQRALAKGRWPKGAGQKRLSAKSHLTRLFDEHTKT